MFIPRTFTRSYSGVYSGTPVQPFQPKIPAASKIPKSFCSTLSENNHVPPIDKNRFKVSNPCEHLKTQHLSVQQLAKEDSSEIYLSAALKGNLEMLTHLVENKLVDINAHNTLGESALKLATCAGHLKCVEYLLKQGADLYSIDHEGNTPACGVLDPKCASNRCSILDVYVKQGLNLNAVRMKKHNLMINAVDSKDYELMSYLLNNNFDCSMRSTKCTPVYVAMILKDFKALDMLIRAGAPFIPETEVDYIIISDLMDYTDLDTYLSLKQVLPQIDTFFFDIAHSRWRQGLAEINELKQQNESLINDKEYLEIEVKKYKNLLDIICRQKAELDPSVTDGPNE